MFQAKIFFMGLVIFGSSFVSVARAGADEFAIFKCKATRIVATKHFAKFDLEKFSEVTLVKNRITGALRAKIGDQEYSEAKDRFTLGGPFGKNEWVTIWPANSELEIEIVQSHNEPVRTLAIRESAQGKAIFVADLDCHQSKKPSQVLSPFSRFRRN